ncbi:hypothetical protein THIOKS12480021 [Thiocapsa sp. KS1]|nr:hypothetical protein THIOKS12480021 [Thiocapsa sp. KS1]
MAFGKSIGGKAVGVVGQTAENGSGPTGMVEPKRHRCRAAAESALFPTSENNVPLSSRSSRNS